MAKDSRKIEDITLDAKNANKGTLRGVQVLEDSLRKAGIFLMGSWTAERGRTFIYLLADPTTGEVRYIGKANDPAHRLMRHCWHTKEKRDTHVSRWIAKLKAKDMRPWLGVLEETSESNWRTREKYWVRFFRRRGARLTNLAEGGNGAPVRVREETKRRQGLALRGKKHTRESRRRISESRKGMVFSSEHRVRLSVRKKAYFADVRNTFGLSRFWAALTDEQARQVWALAQQGEVSQREIGERFGVPQSTVSEIKHGKRYKHALEGMGLEPTLVHR